MDIITKICSRCHDPKELEEFGASSRAADGKSTRCRACRKIESSNTRAKYAAIYRQKQADRYADARELLMDLKSKPCTDCGNSFPWFCMDYDHRDPKTKIKSVSQWLGSGLIAPMLAEIERCDLLCAICHRIRTFIQYEDGILSMGRPRKYA